MKNAIENPMIELRDVTIELGGETILANVNLKIWQNETAVIIGPSGAGKTVLMKTMAGIIHPKCGKVFCKGIDLSELSQTQKHDLARTVGMQFQQNALFDERSAYQNIEFILSEHLHLSPDEKHKRIIECLRAVDLDRFRDFHEAEMSGGMRRRLAIARAIALKPQILFLDDPTAGQDPLNSDNMAELILRLKAEIDATLVVITPDMIRAFQFAGKIYFVCDKSVLNCGTAQETMNHADQRVQQFVHGYLHGPLTDDSDAPYGARYANLDDN